MALWNFIDWMPTYLKWLEIWKCNSWYLTWGNYISTRYSPLFNTSKFNYSIVFTLTSEKGITDIYNQMKACKSVLTGQSVISACDKMVVTCPGCFTDLNSTF